ncbi:MAG: hypothetical protein HFI26_16170 [Lachnospiraceae bacterium]|nr:hypothetical protein [Lachnospiraceae bacterium]
MSNMYRDKTPRPFTKRMDDTLFALSALGKMKKREIKENLGNSIRLLQDKFNRW